MKQLVYVRRVLSVDDPKEKKANLRSLVGMAAGIH